MSNPVPTVDKTLGALLLETADQTFIGHLVYHYSISNYAKPQSLTTASVTWSLILQLTVGAIVGAIVKGSVAEIVYLSRPLTLTSHSSFGLRVWRFSGKNYWIAAIILVLTLGQLGTAIAFTVEAFKIPSVFAVYQLKTLGTISLALGVATDVITAAALCYFLNRLRTGLVSSDSIVNSLIRYAINTGALTSACSLTTLLLYNLKSQDNLYFIATYFIVSKMYAISYMATLNTRRTVRGRGTDRQGGTTGRQDNNNTNLFPLGTRVPSLGPMDIEGWSYSDKAAYREEYREEDEFPLNTFAPSMKIARAI
ncbi:hypothetical protein C0995_011663 [Termitomyces sp. Mi166|nr:hypothetical protein C0995_011663 [Termitomyces sp. Mi166\